MQPFRGIFLAVEGESGSIFDPALLFAIFMYWLLALGMHALIGWLDRKIAAVRYQQRLEAAGRSTTPTTVARPDDPGQVV